MGEDRDIINIVKDPCDGSFISLLVSSVSFDSFLKLYNTLFKSDRDYSGCEILVKIDNTDHVDDYYRLLRLFSGKYKILIYDKFFCRLSNHVFFNDLAMIGKGKLIWPVYEDLEIVHGDWLSILNKIYNDNIYRDRIYNIAFPMDNGKGTGQICGANIVTREWRDFFKIISPFPNLDRWLRDLSSNIDRYIGASENDIMTHFPQGSRTLSKSERKQFFYPELEKYIQWFKEDNKGE